MVDVDGLFCEQLGAAVHATHNEKHGQTAKEAKELASCYIGILLSLYCVLLAYHVPLPRGRVLASPHKVTPPDRPTDPLNTRPLYVKQTINS